MAKSDKVVIVNLNAVSVEFRGLWSRNDLDKAYRLMLKRLGAYYHRLKQEDKAKKEAAEAEAAEKQTPPTGDENEE